ncbi:MAG: HEAT repeat domain-containing protein [Myxococcota bacterium]|nr:HEAT repeat domain-containing protein [Myxococcota bacterium]
MERAARVVVGRIDRPARIDLHGWAANLRVERELAPPDATALAPTRIAWEELAEGRPARFAQDERVLVALEPLPGYSLWRQRFPKGDALAVAARGRAFLHDPDAATLAGIARWAALDAAAREQGDGLDALMQLAASAEPRVARAALARADRVPGLALRLPPSALASLRALLADGGRPLSLRAAGVGLIGRRGVRALRPELEGLAASDTELAAPAWEALAAQDGGLPAPAVERLLASDDAARRVVGARHAAGTPAEARLAELLRADPDPDVRATAVVAWTRVRGAAGFEAARSALFDAEPRVRAEAARALGSLGEPVVPALRALAEGAAGPEAAGPMAALGLAGPAGRTALLELSREHPDERTRALARLMLGRDPVAHH